MTDIEIREMTPRPAAGVRVEHAMADLDIGALFDEHLPNLAHRLADMGVEFDSAMPAFGDVLSDAEIEAILGYIASTWPEDIRAAQEARE